MANWTHKWVWRSLILGTFILLTSIHAPLKIRVELAIGSAWHPTPVLLPRKSHGRRSLVGCSLWGRWVRHDWATSLSLFTFMLWRRKWKPTPVFLPGESQGQRGMVGCRLWGHTELETTEATWQQPQCIFVVLKVRQVNSCLARCIKINQYSLVTAQIPNFSVCASPISPSSVQLVWVSAWKLKFSSRQVWQILCKRALKRCLSKECYGLLEFEYGS